MGSGHLSGTVRTIAASLALLLTLSIHAQAQQRATGQEQRDAGRASAGTRVADGLLARQPGGGAAKFAPLQFDPASAPVPLRLNNYLAVKRPSAGGSWPGQTGVDRLGYAIFDDPAQAVRAFIEVVRSYHDRGGARSALDIFQRLAPPTDCTGAPTPRPPGGGCPENEVQPRIYATRAARAVGLRPEDDMRLFGAGGEVNAEAMRALLDAVASQEIGPPLCPQPPRGETWLGCRIDDGLFRRALALTAAR